MPQNFVDWFDINNPEHIAAYQHSKENKSWPRGFLPEPGEVRYPIGWTVHLDAAIARRLLVQREEIVKVLNEVDGVLEAGVRKLPLRSIGDPNVPYIALVRTVSIQLLGSIRRVLDPFRRGEGPR